MSERFSRSLALQGTNQFYERVGFQVFRVFFVRLKGLTLMPIASLTVSHPGNEI